MLNPTAVTAAGRAMVDKGGEKLAEATRRRTPIDVSPSGGLPRERPRGTLRDSITRGPVRQHTSTLGRGWQLQVYTEDPVGPYVEWNTRPHEIRPTAEHVARAAAEGRQAMLRFFHEGQIRYAAVVHHPGTQGQHMFARAAAFLEVEVPHMFSEELERFGRDLTSGRGGRILNRTGRGSVGEELDDAVKAFIRSHTIPISRGK